MRTLPAICVALLLGSNAISPAGAREYKRTGKVELVAVGDSDFSVVEGADPARRIFPPNQHFWNYYWSNTGEESKTCKSQVVVHDKNGKQIQGTFGYENLKDLHERKKVAYVQVDYWDEDKNAPTSDGVLLGVPIQNRKRGDDPNHVWQGFAVWIRVHLNE